MNADLEVQAYAERTTLFNLTAGSERQTTVVRVKYRKKGTRRWTRCFIVPHEGQSIDDLLDAAPTFAAQHAAGDMR